jgi:hypothetical protein
MQDIGRARPDKIRQGNKNYEKVKRQESSVGQEKPSQDKQDKTTNKTRTSSKDKKRQGKTR